MTMTAVSRPVPVPAAPGAYFAVLASSFVALVLLLLIFDQLGTNSTQLTWIMVAFPAALFAIIGAVCFSNTTAGWHACDRLCPPALGAASTLAGILGCTGFVALPGAFFFLGFDALPFSTGIILGLLLHAVLIAPFARKDGAFTVAGYIGRRFESRTLRLAAAMVLTLPCLLLMIGEFKIASFLIGHVLHREPSVVVMALAAVSTFAVVLSGMRGAVWGGAAGGLIALLVMLALPMLGALLMINLPLPQISYSLAASETIRLEALAGMDTHRAAVMVMTLPGAAPAALVKPFMQAFVANDRASFALLTLTIALGVASMPALFARAGVSPSVASTRRMSVWLMCLAGAVALTLPAAAFFTRLAVMHALPSYGQTAIPPWLDLLGQLQLAVFDQEAATAPVASVHFTRDSINLLLPMALGLPRPLIDIVLAGAVAAALAAISAEAMSLGGMWSEDGVLAWTKAGDIEGFRVHTGRAMAAAAIALSAWLSLRVKADPLTLFTWAMALFGSSVFALLVMSVWWKRINQWGGLAALLTGSIAALTQIILSLNGSMPLLFGVSGAVASVLAVPLSIAIALAVSLATPVPEHRMVELARDIRMPGGETVHDREFRIGRIPKRAEA